MKEYLIHITQTNEVDCAVACVYMIFRYYGYLLDYEWLRNRLIDSNYGTSLKSVKSLFEYFGIPIHIYKTNYEYINTQYTSIKKSEFPVIALMKSEKENGLHYIVIYSMKKGYIRYSDPNENTINKIRSNEFIHRIKYYIKPNFLEFSFIPQKFIINENNNFILKSIKDEKSKLIIIVILSLFISLIGIVLASKFGLLIDLISDRDNPMFVVYFSLLFFLLTNMVVFKSAISYVKNIISIESIKNIEYNINSYIIKIFINNGSFGLRTFKTGEIMARINDCMSLGIIINNFLVNVLPNIIISVLGLVYMFILNFKLFFVVIFSCLIVFFISIRTFSNIYNYNISEIDSYSNYYGEFLEIVENIDEIKTTYNDKYYFDKIKDSLEKYKECSLIKEKYSNYISICQNMFSILCGLIVLLFGLFYVMESLLTVGNLAIFITISEIIQSVVIDIILFQIDLESFLATYNRILHVFFQDVSKKERLKKIEIKEVESINFKDFSIFYGEKEVLSNSNISFNKKNILIKGNSGSGKSSIVKCIAGLSNNFNGVIQINNKCCIGKNNLHIVYLSNNSALFSGTIKDNICLGKRITNKKIYKLCEEFSIIDFVNSFSERIYHKIEPNQLNVSTGQKQRIALVRSVIAEPDILILDEALSNIDKNNKQKIISNLNKYNFMKIYVSHDEIVIKDCDSYVIDNKVIRKEEVK